MVLGQKWVADYVSDVKIDFGHIWSLNATIFELDFKNGFFQFSSPLWSFKCDHLYFCASYTTFFFYCLSAGSYFSTKAGTKEIPYRDFFENFSKSPAQGKIHTQGGIPIGIF